MAKKFKNLIAKMSPERQAIVQARVEQMIAEMPLDELREARSLTQEHLAKILRVNQAAVSKMEHRTDMYLSTLESFIAAMGGQLQIRAVFPEGVICIRRLGQLEKPRRARRARKQTRVA